MTSMLYRKLSAIRRNRGELLKDMAEKLSFGVAGLSAIEHAKNPIPKDFFEA